jgi:CDP-diacylglycerol--serine O-phosphatidyltransferase
MFGVFLCMDDQPVQAIYCLMAAGVLDAFDGKIARTKARDKAEKRFGIQIDSLNDVVSFGVLPAAIGYSLGLESPLMRLLLCAYALAALIRLAFFNVQEEERQDATDGLRSYYVGLPVTSIACIFPTVYIVSSFSKAQDLSVFAAMFIVVGLAFITPLKIRKPGNVGLAAMGVVSFAELSVMLFVI